MEKHELPIFHKNQVKKAKKLPLFGDTLFTSFRTYNGKVPSIDDHLRRLEEGITYFYPREDFKPLKSRILEGLKELISHSKRDLRYRITVYQEADEVEFYISTYLLPKPFAKCELIRARSPKYPSSVPSNIKWGNNYSEIFHELRWAIENGYDEVIFYTPEGNITECSTSNIFLVKGEKIFTPRPNKYFLTGILRNNLVKKLKVEERDLTFNDLKNCDEVFLTNSVRGIVHVTKFEEILFKENSKMIIEENGE